jgi:hypothetical protein
MGETMVDGARNGVAEYAGRTGEWLPLREAAERLGVSLDSVRRRLRAKTLQARQETILGGHRWLVWVDGGAPGAAAGVAPPPSPGGAMGVGASATPLAEDTAPRATDADDPQPSGGASPDARHETPHRAPGPAPQAPTEALVAAQRAEEMARYTAGLLEPWRRRVEELSRENGRLEERAEHLQTELEVTRAQLAEATAPKEPPEAERAPSPAQGERRWWQRLLWG